MAQGEVRPILLGNGIIWVKVDETRESYFSGSCCPPHHQGRLDASVEFRSVGTLSALLSAEMLLGRPRCRPG